MPVIYNTAIANFTGTNDTNGWQSNFTKVS